MSCCVLCLNSGSSSLKFALYLMGEHEETLVAEGAAERIGAKRGRLLVRGPARQTIVDRTVGFPAHRDALESSFHILKELALPFPDAAGHRIVHGGMQYTEHARIDHRLISALHKLVPYAPLHLPAGIQGVEVVRERFRSLPQVACFDTAFHHRMPEVSRRFALPRSSWDEGVQRYGFHGLSYEYIVDALGTHLGFRTIVAHLGNGVSMAAVKDGQPIDTTMGFTPAGGCMMGTRSGDLDPGILIYLLKEKGYDAAGLEHLVNHEAGLLGVSGISRDMKTLLDMRDIDPHASEAVEMFCVQIRKSIGALATVLGGLDLLVFTGGIGERAAEIRLGICRGLEHLGIIIDEERNDTGRETFSATDSRCDVRIVPTREDLMIARHTFRLIT